MPKLGKLNLDKIQPPASLPAGRYTARLMDVTDGQSRSNKEMWTWTWEISTGEFAGKQIKSFTLTEAGENLISLRQHLEAFGFSGELNGVDTDKLLGKTAILVLVKGKRKDQNTGKDVEVTNVQNVVAYKKAAPVVADDGDDDDDEDDAPVAKPAKPVPASDDDDDEDDAPTTQASTETSDGDDGDDADEEETPPAKTSRKRKPATDEDELPVLD